MFDQLFDSLYLNLWGAWIFFLFFFLNNSKASSHDEDIGHNKISSKAKNNFSVKRAYADLRLIF